MPVPHLRSVFVLALMTVAATKAFADTTPAIVHRLQSKGMKFKNDKVGLPTEVNFTPEVAVTADDWRVIGELTTLTRGWTSVSEKGGGVPLNDDTAKSIAGLTRDIDERIALQKGFGWQVNQELFERYFGTDVESAAVRKTGSALNTTVGKVLLRLDAAGQDAAAFGETLVQVHGSLKTVPVVEEGLEDLVEPRQVVGPGAERGPARDSDVGGVLGADPNRGREEVVRAVLEHGHVTGS
jgi:hypothetical protein